MRALKAAVAIMGVLIVAGVATIVVTIVNRSMGPGVPAAAARAVLDEADGTRIAGIAATADRIAVQLQGGGPDRVVLLDARSGAVTARIGLAH